MRWVDPGYTLEMAGTDWRTAGTTGESRLRVRKKATYGIAPHSTFINLYSVCHGLQHREIKKLEFMLKKHVPGIKVMKIFCSLPQKNARKRQVTMESRNELRLSIVTWVEESYRHPRRRFKLSRLTLIEFKFIIVHSLNQSA